MLINGKGLHRFIPIILSIAFFLNIASAQTETSGQLWNQANDCYARKQYDSALNYYNKLLADQPENAELHYNIGNTHYRLNHVGLAILHFKKSLHLEPHNKLAKDNLKLATARIQNPLPEIDPIFFLRWWEQLVQACSSNTWAWLSLASFIAVLLIIYYRQQLKTAFANSGRWLATAIVAFILLAAMTGITYNNSQNSGKAVVLSAYATLVETPQPGGKVMNNIPEGTVLDTYVQQGEFLNVKLPNGRMGWVRMESVAPV